MRAWIIGAVALSGVVGLFLFEHRRERQAYRQLEEQVEDLRRDGTRTQAAAYLAGRLNGSLPAPRTVVPAAAPAGAQAQAAPEEAKTDREKRAPPTPRQQVDFIASAYKREDRDAEWARESESALHKDLAAISGQQTKVTDLECHQTLCRAEIVHHGQDGFYSFTNNIMGNLKWSGASTFLRELDLPTGEIRSVMFFAKQAMPVMDDGSPR